MIEALYSTGKRSIPLPQDYETTYYPGRRKVTQIQEANNDTPPENKSKGRLIDILA